METDTRLEFHPLAGIFPLLDTANLHGLVADIAEHGLNEPIALYEGKILDGRNRYEACRVAGVDCRFTEYSGPDALAFVISLNLHRRHLNESQRAMVAARIANLQAGRPAETASIDAVSQGEAADRLSVGRSSVQRAAEVQEHGAIELQDAVEQGAASVSAAAEISKLSVGEQLSIVARGEKEILHAAKTIRKERAKKKREERLTNIALANRGNEPLDTTRPYPVILADPAWERETWGEAGKDRDPSNHYPTMSLEELRALPVEALASPDAVIFMWATGEHLAQALTLMGDWGFTYKACAVWVKPSIGMGYWFRYRHEQVLVGTRGSMPAPLPGTQITSVIEAPRGAHSEKPEDLHLYIEKIYPDLPRIELFARAARAGWSVWGNQADS